MELKEYRTKWCPICDQGWVEIVRIISTNELVLCCSECESEWRDPANIMNDKVEPYNEEPIEDPDWEDIVEKGWDRYVLK
ncbi:hypothetical protein HYE59_12390 [Aggregatibacter actinomycetemcomitans]|uniref:hypothetical protein n=1 Tax=Aggregatibacter actinomycetemcomitans TaxID=714 RepID=UPI00197B50B7|nr:hypothetical protein [Aggregatibacter actinomycetemcomitans]MBN6078294.1 hypothetical protein [Aggregatibacter actinomycetemcomitans]